MISSRTILKQLKNIDQYLNQFIQREQSMHFERFISETISRILYLPFFASDNDKADIPHRLTWQGTITPLSKASQGVPDAIAYCHNFHISIEATLKTGAIQWSQEFAQSIRHCETLCTHIGIQPENIYTLLICSSLHEDTYRATRSNPREEYKLVPITIPDLIMILETSILAFTMKHLEFRKILNQISECIRSSSCFNNFCRDKNNLITNWQKEVFEIEKKAVIGVKSYEAMRKINRTHIGASEILQRLERHPIVNRYLKILDDKLSFDIIEDSLIQHSLACQLSPTYEGEKLFSPVPFADFKHRGLRLIKAVEGADG